MTGALLPGTTTEWEDIQVRLGNFAPRPETQTRDEIESRLLEAAEEVDLLAKSSLSTLDRLIEHDGGDEEELRELERIRNLRLEQLQQKKSQKTFGRVFSDINKLNFVDQITNSSQHFPVICHIFSPHNLLCAEISRVFDYLANRHKSIKFASGRASEIFSAEFPEGNLPMVVLYKGGVCVRQFVKARPEDVAKLVAEAGMRASSEDEGSEGEELERLVRSRAKLGEDGEDDREYSSTTFARHVLRRR